MKLPQSKPLQPLFEAIVNSFQSLEELGDVDGKSIRIFAERDTVLDDDPLSVTNSPICGFVIEDNGVGFNEANIGSFLTSDSDYKARLGGKGVGRFMWLKAFSRAEIYSRFEDGGYWERSFTFSLSSDLSKPPASPTEKSVRLTRISLKDYQSPYKEEAPRSLDILAQRIVEHCLAFFLDAKCPTVILEGTGGEKFNLNEYFGEYIGDRASTHSFSVVGQDFNFRGVRLYHPSERGHALVYAANRREVKVDKLSKSLEALPQRLGDEAGESFVYLGFITGDYLDASVNSERTGFSFPDGIGEVQSALPILTLQEIRTAALEPVKADLGGFIEKVHEQNRQRIDSFVSSDAPQFQPLKRYMDELVQEVQPGLSNDQLDIALHKFQRRKEIELKERGQKLFAEEPELTTYDGYAERLQEFMDEFNDLGKSELAKYVAHRKVVLDFFDKSMKIDPVTGKHHLEETLHNIVFPMRRISEEVPHELQNLWLLDERLTYHRYLASDKPLSSLQPLDSESDLRPDMLVFDRALAFTEGDTPVSSFVIVEFKRPERGDVRRDNPIEQVYNHVRQLRTSHYKDDFGREVKLQSENVPGYAFIVCDLTSQMETLAENASLQKTPDGLGYFGFNVKLNLYVEVLSYTKILRDAKKRNRVLFDKLNIHSN
ncbi:MAG: hypothetical protein BGO01_19295 [Armatimonadetes bacterium 55-13]|nr:MAG: hypothetical protein BGO01_19295 [Armatimonadetes bacterium 55-13]